MDQGIRRALSGRNVDELSLPGGETPPAAA
jgi:hypothetical protein